MLELSDVIGQDTAATAIQRAMHGQRMPHAFIFSGPAGVGRRTMAVALARTLLCSSPKTTEKNGQSFTQACGQCDDCRMMDAETHGDYHPIYKELARYHDDPSVRSRVMQELGIPVIRSFLLDPAGRAPVRGRAKVFVVLEAELMSAAAQNALLKTLEEPPAGVTIILICQQPEQLLPTTLSRCAMVRFGLLPRTFVTEKLTAAGIDTQEAGFWAAFTGGSIGRSLRLSADGAYNIKRDAIGQLAGMSSAGDVDVGETLAKHADTLAKSAVKAAKAESGADLSQMLATRRACGILLEILASAYTDALHLRVGSIDGNKFIHTDQTDAIQTLAGRFDATELAEIIEQLSRYEELLWRNVNPKVVWDNVVITCATAAPLAI